MAVEGGADMKNRYFLGGLLLPHPPVLVPSVGQGREHDAQPTLDAMNRMAKIVADWQPETVVLVSPHAPIFQDFVFFYEPIAQKGVLKGALRAFGDTHEHRWPWDGALQQHILDRLAALAIDAGPLGVSDMKRFNIEPDLDHGALVPLHFLSQSGVPFQLVVLASAGIDAQQLFTVGRVIREEAEALGRRTLLLASGDLSHKVNPESPYGAVPEGERFDHQLMDLFRKSDLKGVATMDRGLREKAAECGFRSILTLCGALEGLTPSIEVHSYEAPFGIGYGVVSFALPPATGNTDESQSAHDEAVAPTGPEAGVSPHVRIARQTIEAFIKKGYRVSLMEVDAPQALLDTRAGTFVSLHKFGDLRGCIGTIAPTTDSLAEEIIQNAISAATGDPRFEPVTANELPHLVIHVDVLNPPEPVTDPDMLNPKQYGVIVEKGLRRGLLLPDLEGVDTVAQQLAIACRKAGINPDEHYTMERFTVTRYES
jgi:AmmeMemoRadiSam system protein A